MTENDYRLLYDIASKRIEELENKIADIKANCDLAIEGRDVKIMDLEKENTELKGNLELYESGGCKATKVFECGVVKELKEQLTKKADTNHTLVEQMAKMESDFRICEKNADTYYDHLTKAKELLQRFIKWARTENCEKFDVIFADAEQFIKEIEK